MDTFEIRDPVKERGGTEIRAQSAVGGTKSTIQVRRGSKDAETKDSVESPLFIKPTILKAQIQHGTGYDIDDAGYIQKLYKGQTFEEWVQKKDQEKMERMRAIYLEEAKKQLDKEKVSMECPGNPQSLEHRVVHKDYLDGKFLKYCKGYQVKLKKKVFSEEPDQFVVTGCLNEYNENRYGRKTIKW